jgi:hypothetical protein
MRIQGFFMQLRLRYMLNTITSIDTDGGHTLTSHAEKAAHIWGEFRNRLLLHCHKHAL